MQGFEISPRDIDFVISREDIEKITKIFKDSHPKITGLTPLSKKDQKKLELKFYFKQVEVQFIGETSLGTYLNKLLQGQILNLEIDKWIIPCLTLKAEAEACEDTNRFNKSKLINEFLIQRKK